MQKRYVLWWLLLTLLVSNTFVTLNMNIAIVSMVNNKNVKIIFNNSLTICPNTTFFLSNYLQSHNAKESITNAIQKIGFEWSEVEQNMVLSGYYWLNYISIMPGGILAHKYGAKKVVGYAQLISSAMSSLIPIAAESGPLTVSWIRALQGALSFMSVPAGVYSIIGNWSPPHERARFGANFLIGTCIGMTLGSFVFGFIGQYLHWSIIFHLTSVCGVIWCIFWYLLVHDSPVKHPTISVEEKEYIENSLKEATYKTKTIIGAPSIAIGILVFGIGYCNDLVIKKGILTATSARKICTMIGGILSMIPLMMIALTKCNLTLIISYSTIHHVTSVFLMFGPTLVLMDLSPKFCGILEGFSGTTSSLLTFVFSAVVNYFSTIYDVNLLWKMVFLSSSMGAIFISVIFLYFGTSEVQHWNYEDDAEKDQPLNPSRGSKTEIS